MKTVVSQGVLPTINRELEYIFDQEIKKAQDVHPSYARLWQSLKAVATGGGKRLRPRLLLQIAGRVDDPALRVAVAHELLHIAMLIHDDIIDKDDIRHGEKNLVGQYKDIYSKATTDVDTGHFAHAAAIIGGDVLVSYAHKLVAESGLDAETVEKLQRQLYCSVFEVIGGQLMDTEAPFMSDYYDPLTIYRYKTASYSFVSPILSGAIIAQLDAPTVSALKQYANALGIAFQLRDDDLGVFGDSSVTGKSSSQDLREGKKTKLIELFMERAGETEQQVFMASFGVKATSEESVESMRQLLVKSGARAAHDALIEAYLEQSLGAIKNIDEPLRQWLTAFAHENADRKL